MLHFERWKIIGIVLTILAGVLFTLPMVNGADFLTTLLLHTFRLPLTGYLAFVGALLLTLLVSVKLLSRRQHFEKRVIVPVLLESAFYALTMGSFIVFVMTDVMGIPPSRPTVMLPTPCAMSSRFGGECRRRGSILSTASRFSRVSSVATRAMVSPAW